MIERAQQFFSLFEKFRGFRPRKGNVDVDAKGTTRIRIPGFAEVELKGGNKGAWAMPAVKTYREGPGSDYREAVELGWPSERGMASKIACIFADWYAKERERGEKPPYFLYSPKDYEEISKQAVESEVGSSMTHSQASSDVSGAASWA